MGLCGLDSTCYPATSRQTRTLKVRGAKLRGRETTLALAEVETSLWFSTHIHTAISQRPRPTPAAQGPTWPTHPRPGVGRESAGVAVGSDPAERSGGGHT